MVDTFGKRLLTLRERRGWSQPELVKEARRHGAQLTKSSLSQLETGKSKAAKPENLFALARALDVDPGYLATGEPYYPQDYDSDVAAILQNIIEMPPSKRAVAAYLVAVLLQSPDDSNDLLALIQGAPNSR